MNFEYCEADHESTVYRSSKSSSSVNFIEEEIMEAPTIRSYGDYESEGYGAHCMQVNVGRTTFYFSYQTIVAFDGRDGLVIRENDWGPTTGKHLNYIDYDHSRRVPGEKFAQLLANELQDEHTFGNNGEFRIRADFALQHWWRHKDELELHGPYKTKEVAIAAAMLTHGKHRVAA